MYGDYHGQHIPDAQQRDELRAAGAFECACIAWREKPLL
jgi:hypothetical protein